MEAAARRQKWIDQAQSLNLYIQGVSGKKLDVTYRMAWFRGLKTTYYLRALGATSVEKSTVDRGNLNAVSNASPSAARRRPESSPQAQEPRGVDDFLQGKSGSGSRALGGRNGRAGLRGLPVTGDVRMNMKCRVKAERDRFSFSMSVTNVPTPLIIAALQMLTLIIS